MAMTKFVLVMAMVLLAVLLLESNKNNVPGETLKWAINLSLQWVMVLADHEVDHAEGEYHLDRNARDNARGDAGGPNTRRRASSSATSAAGSACACLRAITATKLIAPATTTGRLRRVAPNALETIAISNYSVSLSFLIPNFLIITIYYYSLIGS
ncbi:hypothetical protein ACLOJK_022436 [Asimina triloba]